MLAGSDRLTSLLCQAVWVIMKVFGSGRSPRWGNVVCTSLCAWYHAQNGSKRVSAAFLRVQRVLGQASRASHKRELKRELKIEHTERAQREHTEGAQREHTKRAHREVSRESTQRALKNQREQIFRGHSFGGGGGAMPCRGLLHKWIKICPLYNNLALTLI